MSNNLPEQWEEKKLSDVCYVIAGQSPEGKYYNRFGEGLPFYQGKKEFTEKYIAKPSTWTTKITKETEKGDILMSVRAPVGPVNFATEKVCIGRGLAAIRTGKTLDNEYLFYFLQSIEEKIRGKEGAVFASINKNEIENIQIIFPIISEQKRIVKILDEVFKNIDKAKTNYEQNLKNSKEIFENYLNNIFDNLGDDWEEKNFENCIENIKYTKKINKKNFLKKGNYPIVSQEQDYINGYWNNIGDIFKVDKPIIIFGDHTKVIKYIDFDFVLGADGVKIFKTIDEIEPKYFYYFLQNIDLDNLGYARHFKLLKEKSVSYPRTLSEQKRIVKILDEVSEETKKLESIYKQKINALEELKKIILQKAFFGEL